MELDQTVILWGLGGLVIGGVMLVTWLVQKTSSLCTRVAVMERHLNEVVKSVESLGGEIARVQADTVQKVDRAVDASQESRRRLYDRMESLGNAIARLEGSMDKV